MRADKGTLAIFPGLGRTRSLLDDLWRRGVLALLGRIECGALCLVDGDDRFDFGRNDDEPSVTVVVRDPAAYRAILFGGGVGAGEAYMKGQWTCDDLPALARIFSRNLEVLGAMRGAPARLTRRLAEALAGASRRNTRGGSRRNIAHHYDLSNELFGLFLDDSMTYSSAIFDEPGASLEEAQRTKIDRVCKKLRLEPRDHLLEIGTGWGALAIHAAKEYGCRVTTTTVSSRQHALTCERVRAAGLEGRVDVLLRDYRDLGGRYDKVVSVEMIEAVGHEYMDDYFRACSEHLAPDGMMLVQAITIADQHHERHRASVDFIKEHIFPGSSIPSVTSMVTSATRATDLRLAALEELTPHYARTLRIWRERFLGKAAEVRRLGFGDEFVRKWEYYLASCEGAFEERYLGCVHMVFTKPGWRPSVAPT
jgi:cyclopropane-fatty-acyl-phospholipid synthase